MADNNANTIRTTEQQRVKEITDKLEEGLKELFQSEKYKSYLNTMSKFHNYSFNNTLLIAMQKPEAKVWEKRMPKLSEEEKLAVEFDWLCFDYDRILYGDSVRSMSENVEELSQEIKTEGTERISDILCEIVTEGVVPEEVERAKEMLDKLSEYKPLAKV